MSRLMIDPSFTQLELKKQMAIRLGGFAGDGLQSTGMLLQKYFNKLGYYVFGFPGTQSTIRGGHVWQHVEFSVNRLLSYDDQIDILVAFRQVSLHVHLHHLRENSVLLYDEDQVSVDEFLEIVTAKGIQLLPLPMIALARAVDNRATVLVNSVAVGALLYILGLDLNGYLDVLTTRFRNRNDIIEKNKNSLFHGYEYIKSKIFKPLDRKDQVKRNPLNLVISGNEMIALGAATSGMKFLAQYPITPASSILTYLSHHADKFGIVVRQAEDELAAISMIIGASFAGVRSMTATSGPGFSLMAEGFGYASMTETPIVLVNAMRAGPSTGVPTKMEQADLNSGIYLSHGESPRVIFAPRNMKECFDITVRAFNVADKYQVPVIIFSDFALSERTETIEPFDLQVDIDRGKIWRNQTTEDTYKRHELTEDGVSHRVFPPNPDTMYIAVGAEHDEYSHSLSGNRCGLPSSGLLRAKMIEKRFKKLELIREEMNPPEVYGSSNAEYTIICWGSLQGAVYEAVDRLNEFDSTWNALSFADIFPLPYEKIRPILENLNYSVIIEVNYTGQFEQLIHNHIDWQPNASLHPLSGENPTPSSIIKLLNDHLRRDRN